MHFQRKNGSQEKVFCGKSGEVLEQATQEGCGYSVPGSDQGQVE